MVLRGRSSLANLDLYVVYLDTFVSVTTSALGAYGQLLPTATECVLTSASAQTYEYFGVVPQLLLVTGVSQDYSSTASAHPRCGGRGTPRREHLTDIILFVLLLSSGLVSVGADCSSLRAANGDDALAVLIANGGPHGNHLWANVCRADDPVDGCLCLKLSWPGAASQPRPIKTKASTLVLENSQCCSIFRLYDWPCFCTGPYVNACPASAND